VVDKEAKADKREGGKKEVNAQSGPTFEKYWKVVQLDRGNEEKLYERKSERKESCQQCGTRARDKGRERATQETLREKNEGPKEGG